MAGKLDTQQVEILGRGVLIAELLGAGIEVARPERDRGIDLIAYLDGGDRFVACPIQMKASRDRSFSIRKHYAAFPHLLMVHVWGVQKPSTPEIYALTYPEALGVAQDLGWTKTKSWKRMDNYVSTKPGPKVLQALAPYRMTAGLWAERLRSASAGEG